jgi:flagellar hook-length control protein FliK
LTTARSGTKPSPDAEPFAFVLHEPAHTKPSTPPRPQDENKTPDVSNDPRSAPTNSSSEQNNSAEDVEADNTSSLSTTPDQQQPETATENAVTDESIERPSEENEASSDQTLADAEATGAAAAVLAVSLDVQPKRQSPAAKAEPDSLAARNLAKKPTQIASIPIHQHVDQGNDSLVSQRALAVNEVTQQLVGRPGKRRSQATERTQAVTENGEAVKGKKPRKSTRDAATATPAADSRAVDSAKASSTTPVKAAVANESNDRSTINPRAGKRPANPSSPIAAAAADTSTAVAKGDGVPQDATAAEPAAHVESSKAETSPTPSTHATATGSTLSAPASRLHDHLVPRSTRKAGEAANLNQADQNRFVQRVARAFDAAKNRDGEIRLRLSPPELGSLRLEVRMQQGGVVARLEAETLAARTLLIDNLPALRERLAEQGVHIEQFDVDLLDRRDESDQRDQSQRRDDGRPQPHESEPPRGVTAGTASDAVARSQTSDLESTSISKRINVII